ncbi:MAG TPA: hypothetical protein DD624_04910 [Alphaproteobacteria bacterium]|nr:hypothetical protein [Alphaproteobacteria bacterium]
MRTRTSKILFTVLGLTLVALIVMTLGWRKQMPHYNWSEVPATETEALINKINALSTYNIFNADRTHLQVADLPFYTNFKLLQATTFSTIPPVTMEYLLAKDGEVIKMDGTREPIFEHNKDAGLVLNEETVVAYATFVLDAVQTDQGTLRLVEHVDEDTFTDTPTPQQRKDVTHMIRPAKVVKTDDGFKLDVIMLYGDSVFRADLDVKNDGYIEIVGEEKLAEGMPVRPIFLE